ncbi:hypothetical protein RFI_09259, partial [Reticulomyxa filosa]
SFFSLLFCQTKNIFFFLKKDMFAGSYTEKEVEIYGLPVIHCYCFAPSNAFEESIDDRLKKFLGETPNLKRNIRFVRNVSANKYMYCVEFQLPHHIAIQQNATQSRTPTVRNLEEMQSTDQSHECDNNSTPSKKAKV